jgi:hypothetical protein
MTPPSITGFGRKLAGFLIIDIIIATFRALWAHGSALVFAASLLTGIPGSLLLAAIWHAADKRRSPIP